LATVNDRSRDLANRMAGWFFLAVGTILGVSAFLIASRFELAAWCIGALAVCALAFGVFAPRERRVSAVDAIVSLVLAFG